MKPKDASGVRFWAIEYARSPNPGGTESGLLCVPLPWDEGGTVRAAVMVYESRPLAEAGLEHYLAWTGQDPASYSLLELPAEELAEILEVSPEGFDRVAINPILSLHFRDAEGYSAGLRTEDFVAELAKKAVVDAPDRRGRLAGIDEAGGCGPLRTSENSSSTTSDE